MPFATILDNLLATTDHSIGAMFLDYEGETVELRTRRNLSRDDLKIVGAYQGIFLAQLRKLCTDVGAGEPVRFKLEFARTKVLISDLKDGYYLVLLVDTHANEGIAWRQVELCRERLLGEI